MISWLKKYQIYWKITFLVLYDMSSVAVSGLFALWIKFDFRFNQIDARFTEAVWHYLPYNIAITLILFYLFHLYHSLWFYAGIVEMEGIFSSCFLSGCIQFVYIHILRPDSTLYLLPRSYYVLNSICLFIMTAGIRFIYRMFRQWVRNREHAGERRRVMVVGAGETGHMIVREILNSRHVNRKLCCIVDDDPQKKGSYVYGIRVVGGRNDIADAVRKYHISEIVIAIPSAGSEAIKELVEICQETGCQIKILPGMAEIISGQVALRFLRDIKAEDLSGKDLAEIDNASILNSVEGKVVLVTGGGGVIGSGLCRQIAVYNPALLVIVDIYENNAYEIQQELEMKYPRLHMKILIASVRSVRQMEEIFHKYRPHLVYHAAAYKQELLMENSPDEAIKNNVFGTWKVMQAAEKFRTDKFVLISTDKAVNPVNITGASMCICEMLVQAFNGCSQTAFSTVRFGNVPLAGSSLAALILQAGAYAHGGEIYELDGAGERQTGKPFEMDGEKFLSQIAELRHFLEKKPEADSLRKRIKEIVPDYQL